MAVVRLSFILLVAVVSCAHTAEPLLDRATYFSSSYQEARTKFLEAARIADADLTSYKHSLTGPVLLDLGIAPRIPSGTDLFEQALRAQQRIRF